ncbi:OadG family protein [Marinobacterium aestuariivivens]|uniref:Probable oxaloacetate decarboxylase gamma chain n=1 Tax=Marinobacterium aestuariivivens TaxID=1698799 RepID=A0ABW1ZXG9_9GAMM
MDNLLSEGLSLMVFGMGFVFVFLTLLVIATGLMSKVVTKYAPAPEPKPARKTARQAEPTGAATAKNDELVAVITAAVHKYRSH